MKIYQGDGPNDEEEKKTRVRMSREGAGHKSTNGEEVQLAMKYLRSCRPMPVSMVDEVVKEVWCGGTTVALLQLCCMERM